MKFFKIIKKKSKKSSHLNFSKLLCKNFYCFVQYLNSKSHFGEKTGANSNRSLVSINTHKENVESKFYLKTFYKKSKHFQDYYAGLEKLKSPCPESQFGHQCPRGTQFFGSFRTRRVCRLNNFGLKSLKSPSPKFSLSYG